MANKTRITIKDVARAAGCGVATASRVLNKSGSASSETRERVEQAARDLGFAFSATGRALQSRKSMTVGCLIPSLANPVFAEAVQGAQEELRKEGYQLLVASSNYDGETDNEILSTLLAKDVDGLLVTMVDPQDSSALNMALDRNVPTCLMFHDPLPGWPSAHVSNAEAAAEVARRFARYGHRRTGFLALRFATSDRSRNRFDGFRAECAAQNLPAPELIEITETEANTPSILAQRLCEHPELTAIFASNDFLAIAVQKAANLMGWHVPQDLSVVGFDGIEVGRLLDRPLATIETTPEAMGRQAAQTLLVGLQGGEMAELTPLPFTFRVGATLSTPRTKSPDDDRGAAQSPSVPPLTSNVKQG